MSVACLQRHLTVHTRIRHQLGETILLLGQHDPTTLPAEEDSADCNAAGLRQYLNNRREAHCGSQSYTVWTVPNLPSATTGQSIDRVPGNPPLSACSRRRNGLSPERPNSRITGTGQYIDPVGHWQLFASPARASRSRYC